MRIKIVALLLLGALVSICFAQQAVETKYVQDNAGGTYRSTLSSDDAADLAATASIATITVGGKQNIRVTPTFSVSAATCIVVCVRANMNGGTYSVEGMTTFPATASNYWTLGGRYVANEVVFDTGGAQYCKVLVQTVSSGNVTLLIKRS